MPSGRAVGALPIPRQTSSRLSSRARVASANDGELSFYNVSSGGGGGGSDTSNSYRPAQLARSLMNWMLDSTGLTFREDEELLPGLMGLLEAASVLGALLDFSFLSQNSIVDSGNDAAVFRGTCVQFGGGAFEVGEEFFEGSAQQGRGSGGGGGSNRGNSTTPLKDVAIKVFKPPLTGLTSATLRKIVREAEINMMVALPGSKERKAARASFPREWRAGSPPPIVPFLGVCNCPPDISLVTAWCSGGTLRNWLDKQVERRRKAALRNDDGSASGGAAASGGPKSAVRYVRGAAASKDMLNRGTTVRAGDGGTVLTLPSDHCEPGWGWVVGITAADIKAMPLDDAERWPVDDLWGLERVWAESGGAENSARGSKFEDPNQRPALTPLTIERLHLAADAAAGLAFLSSFSPPLAHRDIKSLNFFVSKRQRPPAPAASTAHSPVLSPPCDPGASPPPPILEALLGDFGDAVECPGRKTLRKERGTLAYMAPEVSTPHWEEVLERDGISLLSESDTGNLGEEWEEEDTDEGDCIEGVAYDNRCDIYGLAIVLWEIVTGGSPFPGLEKKSLFKQHVHTLHARPPIHPSTPRALSFLMRTAWHPDPTRRPSAKLAARVLERCCSEAMTQASLLK